MAKERMLTVLIPIKDEDATVVASLPAIDPSNINVIYKHEGVYKRLWLNPSTHQYEYHEVVDREFPHVGNPLNIVDFTYDAKRMGTAPVISAQGVMWEAEKDSTGNDITLKELWSLDCHVVFKGEKFYLKEIPHTDKTNEDERYKYDLDFLSERSVIEHVYLYDVVRPFITEKPVSENSVFSFYGDINELSNRINASLILSGLARVVYKDGVTEDDFLTYDEFNAVGLGTYSGSKDTRDPYPAVAGEMQSYIHYPHANIYEHFGGNYTKYLLNRVYYVENPTTVHIGPSGSGYDEIVDGDLVIVGFKCRIGKDKYGNISTSEEKLISFDNNTIHEALQKIKEEFHLQYYATKETNIEGGVDFVYVVGDCEKDFADVIGIDIDGSPIYLRDSNGIPKSTSPFDYGYDNELLSKGITPSNDKLITRITGTGSSENIPWHYPNPTADGWIKPVYKKNGEATGTSVKYQSTEGRTAADSALYEKYLKNRIGDVFKFGNTILVKNSGDYIKSASGFDRNYDAIVVRYYISNISDATNPKMLILFKINEGFRASRVVATLDNLTDSTTYATYDSIAVYPNPSPFQNAMMSGNADVSVGLNEHKKYALTLSIYKLANASWPLSDKYDYEGYYYPATNIQTQYGVCKIPDNFYNVSGLVPYTYRPANYSNYIECGYSLDGTVNTAVSPLPRMANKQYLDKSSQKMYRCLSSAKGDSYTGKLQTVFQESPMSTPDEIVERFITLKISVLNTDGWYLNSKKVPLIDYGILNEHGILNESGLNENATVFDTIEFKRIKYLTPQQTLMPEVYIKTDGGRRFYDAKNYDPLSEGTPDTAIGEYNPTGTSYIANRIYQVGNTDTHYVFENLCRKNHPVEHIEEMDDVKPTIEGQTNTIGGTTFRIDVVEEFAYDQFDNDEVWESTDGGDISGEYKHPYFFAKLRPLGFNIFDLALQEDMVISMKTGHCGACNFKIGVDENTKKNPVQIWEYDVYAGPTYAQKGNKVYSAGELRRYVDTTNLHYDTDGTTSGYVSVDNPTNISLKATDYRYQRQAVFEKQTYSGRMVMNGEVGSLKQEPKKHFEGDVMIGKFCDSQQDTTSNYVWVALYKDVDTYGTIMPSARPDYDDGNYSVYIEPKGHKYHNRKTGEDENYSDEDADKFVLINIKMPQIYLRRAERELSKKLVEFMYNNNYNKFNFSINFSSIFFAENEDVEDTLNENSVMYIKFDNKTYRQYVSHYSYKSSSKEALADVTVELNDEVPLYINSQNRITSEIEEHNRRALDTIKSAMETERRRTNRDFVSSNGGIVFGDIVFAKTEKSSFEIVDGQSELVQKQKENTLTFRDIDNFNDDVTDAFKQIEYTVQKSTSKSDARWWTSYGKAPLNEVSELIVPQRINRLVEKNDFEDESFDESFK